MFSATTKEQTAQSRLASDIKEGAHAVKEDIRATAGKVREDLNEAAYEAGCKARRYIESSENAIADAAGSLSSLIKEKPVQAGLIAAGIGFLLGLLFQRR